MEMVNPDDLARLHGNLPRNKGMRQRFFYMIGSFVEHTIGPPPKSDAEIKAMDPEDVRHKGRVTATLGALGLTAALLLVPHVLPDEKLPFVPQPEQVCDFSSNTTVVTRQVSQSDPQLGVIHVKGVNYGHGINETSEWINAHNQDLQGWVGEQVTIPVSYDCHPK